VNEVPTFVFRQTVWNKSVAKGGVCRVEISRLVLTSHYWCVLRRLMSWKQRNNARTTTHANTHKLRPPSSSRIPVQVYRAFAHNGGIVYSVKVRAWKVKRAHTHTHIHTHTHVQHRIACTSTHIVRNNRALPIIMQIFVAHGGLVVTSNFTSSKREHCHG
jgi:hypothetical protein